MALSMKAVLLLAGTSAGIGLTDWLLAQFPEYTALAAIAGIMGGTSRWIGKRQAWWPHGLGSILAGLMSAVALWPLGQWLVSGKVADLNMDPRTAVMFGAYITGVTGVSLIGMLIDLGEIRRRDVKGGDDDKDPS